MGDFLLLYDYVENMLERRVPHREAHLAHVAAAREAGRLTLAGALGEPVSGGALVFRDCAAADVEAFVKADPYVHAGLISAHRILPWKLV